MKVCRICSVIKSFDEFPRNKGNSDGFDSRCKKCRSVLYQKTKDDVLRKAKDKYNSDPELFRSRRRASHKKHADSRNTRRRLNWDQESRVLQNETRKLIRNSCFDILGGSCKCGVKDYDVLCVDHINDDGQQERKSGISSITVWRRIIRGENNCRYQLLCFNCNLKKSVLRDRVGDLYGFLKKCKTCLVSKDISFFKLDHKYKDGHYYECRSCSRNRVIALKAVAISKIGSNRCSSCNEGDFIVLTFDHIDNDGFESRSQDGLGEILYRRIVNGSIDINRFQILCLNCNLKKYRNMIGAKNVVAGFKSLSDFSKKDKTSSGNNVITPQERVKFDFSESIIKSSVITPDIVLFFENYHYSGYGRNGSIHILCYVNDEIAAVAKFASAVRQEVATSLKLPYESVLELDRFCINPKFQLKNFASFFLASSSRVVKKIQPDLVALVSFADPAHGHHGIIYKASNWVEVKRRVRNDYQYRNGNGVIHKKTVFDSAKSRGLTEFKYATDIGLEKILIPSKRKFVFYYK